MLINWRYHSLLWSACRLFIVKFRRITNTNLCPYLKHFLFGVKFSCDLFYYISPVSSISETAPLLYQMWYNQIFTNLIHFNLVLMNKYLLAGQGMMIGRKTFPLRRNNPSEVPSYGCGELEWGFMEVLEGSYNGPSERWSVENSDSWVDQRDSRNFWSKHLPDLGMNWMWVVRENKEYWAWHQISSMGSWVASDALTEM